MVQIKNPIKSVMLPLAVGSLLFFDGCKKDEPAVIPPSNTDLLIGDWKMINWGGDDLTQYDNEYHYLFKFQSSGDWQFCYEESPFTPAYAYCFISGKWKWKNADEKVILFDNLVDQDGNAVSSGKFDIIALEANKLEGTLTYDVNYTSVLKFVKVQ